MTDESSKPLSHAAETFVRGELGEAQAIEILHSFSTLGLRAAPLKGVLFRKRLYDDPAERPMADVDLLIHPDHFDSACKHMETLGYAPDQRLSNRIGFGAVIERVFVREGRLKVELHRAVATGLGAARFSRRLFDNAPAAKAPFAFPGIIEPTTEATLIALALHFRDHGLVVEPFQLDDVRRLIERMPPDWERVERWANLAQAQFATACLLEAAGCPLPVSIAKVTANQRRLLHSLMAPSMGGFVLRGRSLKGRIASRAWRLALHTILTRDSLSESALSQLMHLGAEARIVWRAFRQG